MLESGLKLALLTDYDHEIGLTRKVLECVPDDRLDWKPHEKSLSLGGLATHVSHIPTWAASVLHQSSFDVSAGPPMTDALGSRAAIVSAFDAAASTTRTALDKTDAELRAPWTLSHGDRALFTLPKIAAFRTFVLHHLIHHRGQLTVYLALHDITAPGLFGDRD